MTLHRIDAARQVLRGGTDEIDRVVVRTDSLLTAKALYEALQAEGYSMNIRSLSTAPKPGADLYDPASFSCPACGALAGEPCQGPPGWRGDYRAHDARYDVAADWRDLIREEHRD